MAMTNIKSLSTTAPSRPHDYAYDPLYLVSSSKDHYKAAMLAKLSTAEFQICPIFANMFSDLPNHPPRQYIRRKSAHLPAPIGYKSEPLPKLDIPCTKKLDVVGADRYRYFDAPKPNVGDDFVPVFQQHQPTATEDSPVSQKTDLRIKNKVVQTVFRESSVQTSPWEPSFVVGSTDPELLKLDFLKWGTGLPAGAFEIELIERARMKLAWESRCEGDLEKQRSIFAAVERDDWRFRQQKIQDVQHVRLKLLENMLNELHEKSNKRSKEKLKQFAEIKYKEKDQKLQRLRATTKRELRKLDLKQGQIDVKYHPVEAVHENVNHALEMYDHPKRWHLAVDEAITRYRTQSSGVEEFNTLPSWLDRATQLKDCPNVKGTRLCMRKTKWTAPVLKKLHEELSALKGYK